ncbi:peptide chain release factor N(5)-glutamine methyltransferase [Hydrogenimonas thermophila]|uniref:peptide chain release factor N(5)-glutamine methyltransferase n=1 Tax=Hydrogenimonas thermophila TaxID=223786 RepID=UPI002936F4F6|nr:peptide chain release factor N(5)-glutamine methyltransferase [Hydrogenimonas thermophila]WOE71092.1 peptide chain release factor N(5)-glutamine methyltransferase [Hydrogenimonas thermophila]WOE73610.1 peptide chain release factor N(5)-glutamine methyltransferase [Hydrogenimonas thermophila]
MIIEDALRTAAKELSNIAQRPRLEAEILMSYYLNQDRVWLHTNSNKEIGELQEFFKLVKRRKEYEPIEYITRRVSFYDIELEVGPGVLIARPETELLVDKAAEIIRKHNLRVMCEIGIGSGAVSIMLAKIFPELKIVATDISEDALNYAKKNINRYGLESRIELYNTNLLDNIDKNIEIIVSNPPYICKEFNLPKPVLFEPKNALIGGESGDELLRKIILTAKDRDIPHLVCEMGYDQREPIFNFCKSIGLNEPHFYKDLSDLDRGFYLKL